MRQSLAKDWYNNLWPSKIPILDCFHKMVGHDQKWQDLKSTPENTFLDNDHFVPCL